MTQDHPIDWQPLDIPAAELPSELQRLRATCPVPFTSLPGLAGFWSLTRYEDVTRAARDPATFTNGSSRLAQRRVPLESDPPEHAKIRKLLQPFFMPSALARFEAVSRGIATGLIEPLTRAGGGDLMEALARVLPPQVLLTVLGQPREDWRQLKVWCERSYLQVSSSEADHTLFKEADAALWTYARTVVEGRLTEPKDPATDIVSAMLAGRIDARPLDTELVIGAVRLLIAAGHDSTSSSLGICLQFLAEDLQLQNTLRDAPSHIPSAVEEILRLRSPVVMMPRKLAKDVELHGRSMRAGDKVMLNWAAANRDEAAFPDAEKCSFSRTPLRHVVFGHGVHSCLGAPLARQEIRVVLAELLARTAHFEIAGEVRYQLWHRLAPAVLPVRMQARR